MPGLRREPCVLHPAALYQVNRSFSAVLRERQALVGLVHRSVRVNVVPCIRRAQPRRGHVRLELVRGFRRRDPFVQAAVRVLPRAVRDSAMFPVA